MNKKINHNGFPGKSQQPGTQTQIEFPVSFELKVIVETSVSILTTQQQLDVLFLKLVVANEYLGVKESANHKFASHTIRVLLLSQDHLNEMYEALKKLPGIKFAI